jgi:hypothetical protein
MVGGKPHLIDGQMSALFKAEPARPSRRHLLYHERASPGL